MAKPIFIIEAPYTLMPEEFESMGKYFKSKFTDYHVLMVNSNTKEFRFKAFYEKDFTETNFTELKELIKSKLNG